MNPPRTPYSDADTAKCHPASERAPRRPRPTNAAEHKAEALRCLEMSFGPYAQINGDEMIRRAQHHAKAARILIELEQLP